MYAKIIVNLATTEVDELYTYKVPEQLKNAIHIGSRVYIEFGFQKVLGFVLELTDELDFKGDLKEILEVIDFENGLSLEQIELAKKLAYDLNTPTISALNLMYPGFMQTKLNKSLICVNFEELDAEVALLFKDSKSLLITNKLLENYSKIKKEIDRGNLEIKTNIYTYGKRKQLRYYYLVDNNFKVLNNKEHDLVEYLRNNEEATLEELKENLGVSDSLIKKLETNGVINYTLRVPTEKYLNNEPTYIIEPSTTLEMSENKFFKLQDKPYLLYSNNYKFRNEFIVKVSERIIKEGKQVLVITPTVLENIKVYDFIKNALQARVLAFSSKLSNSEYYYNYNQLIDNNVDLVVTTMSGSFLPFNNLGLVIVIDSDDSYYINSQFPKYNTVEVAKFRAHYNNARLMLATVAPTISEYYQYFSNKYSLISSHDNLGTNNIDLVNMKEEVLDNLISRKLKEELTKNINNNQMSVLILNSLAYRRLILCSKCGEILTCPNCKTNLVYSKNKNNYSCYSCNYQTSRPICSCGSSKFDHYGYGLELLKEVLEKEYPKVRITQVDSESLVTENDYQKLLRVLKNKEVDIIIGTYQVASLVSTNISLVGIINIDLLLNQNDYRSSEEVYSLITKARLNENAKLIIQGYNLEHYSIISAINNNYENFFEKELEMRRMLSYPPFNEISRLLITGEYKDIYYFSNYFKKIFSRMTKTQILGPVYLSRIKGIQLIIKYEEYDRLERVINEVVKKFSDKKILVNFERYPLGFN